MLNNLTYSPTLFSETLVEFEVDPDGKPLSSLDVSPAQISLIRNAIFSGVGSTHFSKRLARKFQSKAFLYEEGCVKCYSCGHSEC